MEEPISVPGVGSAYWITLLLLDYIMLFARKIDPESLVEVLHSVTLAHLESPRGSDLLTLLIKAVHLPQSPCPVGKVCVVLGPFESLLSSILQLRSVRASLAWATWHLYSVCRAVHGFDSR